MIVDLFAGPGGWDQGIRAAQPDEHLLGFELDGDACAVATAAGHPRRRGDVYGLDPKREIDSGVPVDVVGSPPCGGLSGGGLKLGRRDLDRVADLLDCTAQGHDHRDNYLMHWEDLRSPLMVEPMRWALALDARSLTLEQVPEALPIWELYAQHLEDMDWSADVAVLNAADFGVPEDRDRAFLVAHRDRPVQLPAPTTPGDQRRPAADVLGPGRHGFPRRNDRDDGGEYRARDMRPNDRPAFTLTEKARSWTLLPEVGEPRQITPSEAGQLQSFPADYPWGASGASRSAQFLMIANAVPPLLAAAVAAVVL